jgi:chaperonin GroES
MPAANRGMEKGLQYGPTNPLRRPNMAFRPLGDRVLVKRVEEEAKTKGGIIIPDTAKEKPQEGEVLAVGPGARDEAGARIPADVKVGDRILFGKWSGTEVKIDGEDLIIMKESDILGIVDPKDALKAAA